MPLTNDAHYDHLKFLIEDISDEVDIHKSLLEKVRINNDHYSPMCIFYSDASSKHYLAVPQFDGDIKALMPKLSAAMHLFSALNSHSALITIASKIGIDDVIYDSINFFVVSKEMAFVYYLPYTEVNGQFNWHEDLSYVVELSSAEMDQAGIDFVHMIHAHVQVDAPPFEASEIFNYLSYNGFAVQCLNPSKVVPYIDMSSYAYNATL